MLGVYLFDLQRSKKKQFFVWLNEFDGKRFWGEKIFTDKIWGTLDFNEESYLFSISQELFQAMINSGAAVKLL